MELIELVRSGTPQVRDDTVGTASKSAASSAQMKPADAKIMAHLRDGHADGVDARTAVYAQWMRALGEDEVIRAEYSALRGRDQKAEYRKRWAGQKLRAVEEKFSQTRSLTTDMYVAGDFLTLFKLIRDEGWSAGMNIARSCVRKGPCVCDGDVM